MQDLRDMRCIGNFLQQVFSYVNFKEVTCKDNVKNPGEFGGKETLRPQMVRRRKGRENGAEERWQLRQRETGKVIKKEEWDSM